MGAAIALGVLILAALLWLRLPIAIHAHAQGQDDGSWAVGGGLGLGPLALALGVVRGVPARASLMVFGHSVSLPRLTRHSVAQAEPDPVRPRATPPRGLVRRLKQLEQHFEEVLGFALWSSRHRHFTVSKLGLELRYSFRDVALTGRLVGAIYALRPLLPESIRLEQYPSWESTDHFSLEASGQVRVRVGVLLIHVLRLRNRLKHE